MEQERHQNEASEHQAEQQSDKETLARLLATQGAETLNEDRVLKAVLEEDEPDWDQLKQLDMFSPKWVVLFLRRSRPIPRPVLVKLHNDRELRAHYAVTLGLLRCRWTPLPQAMNLVHHVRFMDLLKIAKEPYLAGPLKKRIETFVMEIYPSLALGQKMALARQAPRNLIQPLRTTKEREVVKVLLLNYFFTHSDALFMAQSPKTTPGALEELACCARWKQHKEIKIGLLSNPNTPRSMVMSLLQGLPLHQLEELKRNPKLPTFTRRLIDQFIKRKNPSAAKRRF
jgi:hypothetical protein